MVTDGNNITKIIKGYRILAVINLIYGLGFIVPMYVFLSAPLGNIFLVLGIFYFCALPIYLIIYGILSYRLTDQWILPHAMLLGSLMFFSFLLPNLLGLLGVESLSGFSKTVFENPYYGMVAGIMMVIEALISNLTLVSISLISFVITRAIAKSYKKWKNTPPTQPPEDQ